MRKAPQTAGKTRKKPADLVQPDISSCNYLGIISRTLAGPARLVVRTTAETQFSESDLKVIFIRMNTGEQYPVPYFVTKVTAVKNADITLEIELTMGVKDTDFLKGKTVFIPSVKGKKEKTWLDYSTVKGFIVEDSEKGRIGVLTDIYESPAHPVMAISKGGKEILIPVAGDIVKKIDHEKGIVYINAPEGLVDLYL